MIEVNSFWHGAGLTALERMCISSFVKSGVKFNLYVYDPPANLPKGVTVKEAQEILPRSRIFGYQAGNFNLGSVAGFSNLFRYTLLHSKGGWWTDTDVCYLKSPGDEEPEIFFTEPSQNGEFRIASALFKSRANSPILRYCLDRFAEKDAAKIVHGETGPDLITKAVIACDGQGKVRDGSDVFPVPWWEYRRLFEEERLSIEGCSAVHFWNAMVRSVDLDKNRMFPPGSVFETLKRKYL